MRVMTPSQRSSTFSPDVSGKVEELVWPYASTEQVSFDLLLALAAVVGRAGDGLG